MHETAVDAARMVADQIRGVEGTELSEPAKEIIRSALVQFAIWCFECCNAVHHYNQEHATCRDFSKAE
jgi:hypothetical protein